ncbi:flagellar biosynthesis anti-sigma factor FlgM [Flagellatimonas centrodinii]|uniref:flagellar biosynthesis anti-sigma factor FlgM n=1 Tax=Flagellatimonas centrodinii TaxID=2806210 RepID=UPI001EFBBFF1|nr:flagellar biosynthesis anti-sigma factor FlgM [Flagellatimonas centrodinii]ULQ45687.1 flagellar biosynthesis anti-sigma factor FlgM [Flagellatimonas centrodinii]
MKVTTPPPLSAVRSVVPARTPAGGEPPVPVTASSALSLSDAARAPQSPTDRQVPTDEPRVASLRLAVQEGRYAVNAEQIADRLLQWTL